MCDFICYPINKNFDGHNNPRNGHSRGSCYLSHGNDPYFYLSPLKLEIIMENPVRIYLYHSILTNKRIKKIKDYSELLVRKIVLYSF